MYICCASTSVGIVHSAASTQSVVRWDNITLVLSVTLSVHVCMYVHAKLTDE